MGRFLRRLTSAARPVVTTPLWPYVAGARSFVTRRPVIALPSATRVLAVAPHPDDEVLAFGGTLNRLARRGAEVTVVHLTDGEGSVGAPMSADDLAAARQAEAVASCEALGVPPPRRLRAPDGGVAEALDEVVGQLQTIVDEVRPEVVLVTWFGDAHPDHRAAARAVGRLRLANDCEVWAGDVWTPLPPNHLVPLDDESVAAKQAALAAHTTAAATFDLSAIMALDRYRSIHGLAGHGHAEGFLVADAATFARWVSRADAS